MRKILIILFTLIAAGAWAQNQKPSTRAYTSVAEAMSVPMGASYKFDVIENGVISHFVTMRRSDGYLKPDSVMVIAMADSVSIAVRQEQGIQVEWFKKATDKDWYNAFKRMYRYVGLRGGGVAINLKQGYTYTIDTIQIYVGAKDTTNGVIRDLGNDIRGLELRNVSDVTINGNGATISVKGNFKRKATVSIGNGLYMSYYNSVVPLVITDSKNITIRNLNLTGNVQQMTMDATVVEGDSYGLKLQGVQNCTLTNINSSNFATDGLLTDVSPYTKHSCKYIDATNVVSEHNGRQGLTVAGQYGGTYTNCRFSFSGDSTGNYYGHAPKAGVDVEPSFAASDAPYCGDITFKKCVFEGNAGTAFTAALAIDRNISLEDCIIDNRKNNSTYVVIMGIYNFVIKNSTIYTGTGNIYPAWSIGKGQMSILKDNTIYSNSSGILDAVDAEFGCTIDHNQLIGQHTAPFASYFPYIRSSTAKWTNNYVLMDSGMYGGSNRALIQYCALSENNTYASNLDTTGGRAFTVSSTGVKTSRNESFSVNGAVKSYEAGPWTSATPYTTGEVYNGSATIEDAGTGTPHKTTWGQGIPTTGLYNKNDIIKMRDPNAARWYAYECTVSGDAALGTAQFQGLGSMVAGGATGRSMSYKGDIYGTISQTVYPDSAIYNTRFDDDTGMVLLKIPLGFTISSLRTFTGNINIRGRGRATWTVSLTSAGTTFFQPALNIEGDSSLLSTKVRLLRDASNNAYIGFFDTTTIIAHVATVDVTAVTFASAADASLLNASKAWSANVVKTLAGYTILNLLPNHSAALWANMPDKPFTVLANGNVGLGTTTPADLLEISKNVGGTIGSIRFGGSNGRNISAYQNGAAYNLDLTGAVISIHGHLNIDAQKQIQLTDYAATNTGYAKIATSSTGTFDFAVNSILAQSFTNTGRALYGAPINPKAYTVATLPTGNQGDVAVVTDALNPANGATLAGGGAVKVMAFYNGTNWTAVGATTFSTARTLTVSAASTLTLAYSIDYVYTGTVDGTYTLPAINSNTGSAYTIRIFNKSTHNLNINTNAGGSDIYGQGSGATASLVLAPGASANLLPDGTSFDDIK